MSQHPHILTSEELLAGQRNPKTVALIKALGPDLAAGDRRRDRRRSAAVGGNASQKLERQRGKDPPR